MTQASGNIKIVPETTLLLSPDFTFQLREFTSFYRLEHRTLIDPRITFHPFLCVQLLCLDLIKKGVSREKHYKVFETS